MKAFIGVTDRDWYAFLRGRPDLDEVNFWQPGGSQRFRALQVGEPFLFKLHAPEHFVVGGGFMLDFSQLPVWLAWEAFGEPVLVRPRLGQGAFRVMVTDAYGRQCAVTRERALPTLEAAHVKPVSAGGIHMVSNGLLLRSDVHALYDRGYVTVSPDLRFHVSSRLKSDFDNGEPYYELQGVEIAVPVRPSDRPKTALLEWHADSIFKR